MIVYPDDNYNSWISEGDAERYFTGRLHADPWNDADCFQQEQALRTAFRSLQELTLNINDLDSDDQDKQDALLNILKQAQCEQALHELKHDLDSHNAQSLSLGGLLSVKLTQDSQPVRYAERALAALRSYLSVKTVTRTR